MLPFPLVGWFRSFRRSPATPRHCRPAPSRPARYLPYLEFLEDRTVLSTFTVMNLADSGSGSLRQAILDANATPGDDTITFEVTGTVNLSSALPNLSSNIDLQGPGASSLTVRRSQPLWTPLFYRIFTVASG